MQGVDEDDRDRVDGVLRDLRQAADHWAAVLADADATTFCVDLGDVRAVVDADGRLTSLALSPSVTTDYTHTELAARLNGALAVLREAAEADFRSRYGNPMSKRPEGPPRCP